MTEQLTTKYARLGLAFAGCIRDLQNDLKQMKAKGIPSKIIQEREQVINDLIDFYAGTTELINYSASMISHLDSHRRMCWRVIDMAAKASTPDQSKQICVAFTKRD